MKAKKRKLTKREETFCQLYSVLGHPREAAVGAGYPVQDALGQSGHLLAKEEVAERCHALLEKQENEALLGLRRLAFSPINDIVELVASDELPPPDKLATMDLFAVSAIKQTKDGRLEVALYDRFKVLETLLEFYGTTASREPSIYDAIACSSLALTQQGGDASED